MVIRQKTCDDNTRTQEKGREKERKESLKKIGNSMLRLAVLLISQSASWWNPWPNMRIHTRNFEISNSSFFLNKHQTDWLSTIVRLLNWSFHLSWCFHHLQLGWWPIAALLHFCYPPFVQPVRSQASHRLRSDQLHSWVPRSQVSVFLLPRNGMRVASLLWTRLANISFWQKCSVACGCWWRTFSDHRKFLLNLHQLIN